MDSVDILSLWKEYKQTGDIGLRNKLVIVYLEIVESCANKIKTGVPDFVEIHDLISAGVLGLIDAIEGFDLSRGVKFKTYGVPRIRGAIIDELRAMDWLPRSLRSKVKKYKEVEALSNRNSDLATTQEIADRLDIPVEDVQKIKTQRNISYIHFCSITRTPSDSLLDNRSLKPEGSVDFNDLISHLTDEEQIILILYYQHGFKIDIIGEFLGFSKSKVSYIHCFALQKIKYSLSS